jgi:hypothetical protein
LVGWQVGCDAAQIGEGIKADTPKQCVKASDLEQVLAKSVGTDCARITASPRNAVKVQELKDDMPSNINE